MNYPGKGRATRKCSDDESMTSFEILKFPGKERNSTQTRSPHTEKSLTWLSRNFYEFLSAWGGYVFFDAGAEIFRRDAGLFLYDASQ